MDVLVRSVCECIEPRSACAYCHGGGMLDRWLPLELLPLLRQQAYVLMGCRNHIGS
jgi:hypothetical protein